jgi:acetolactate synthase I/II/III large subunit
MACMPPPPKVWFARQYPAYHPNTLLLDNALATMGAGLPSAMASKLVKPEVRLLDRRT